MEKYVDDLQKYDIICYIKYVKHYHLPNAEKIV